MYCDFANTDLRSESKYCRSGPSLAGTRISRYSIYCKMNSIGICTVQLKVYAEQGLHFMMFDDREWFMNEANGFIKE